MGGFRGPDDRAGRDAGRLVPSPVQGILGGGGRLTFPTAAGLSPIPPGRAAVGVQPSLAMPVGRMSVGSSSMGGAMSAAARGDRSATAAGNFGLWDGPVGHRPDPGWRTLPGGMGVMGRPPVGNYPFRVPPSLVAPALSVPGMSM